MKIPFLQSEKSEEVKEVNINRVIPNPYQPRHEFEQDSIAELAESIKNYGVIQPLTVRPRQDGFELIAGERRLRAAKYLGFDKVPVIIREFDNQEMAEIALVENLQRKDLDFIEESQAYSRLLDEFNLTQKELAEKLGKSQSTVANKLRLLSLPDKIKKELKSSCFSERHARALLQLEDLETQLKVVEKIKEEELTVRETEELISKFLEEEKDDKDEGSRVTVFKDLRVFTNTLNKTIKEMKEAGLEVEVDREKDEEFIEYTIRLPRNQQMGTDA